MCPTPGAPVGGPPGRPSRYASGYCYVHGRANTWGHTIVFTIDKLVVVIDWAVVVVGSWSNGHGCGHGYFCGRGCGGSMPVPI